jgi:hypothetical protein
MRAALVGLGLVMAALLACGRNKTTAPAVTSAAVPPALAAPPVASTVTPDPTLLRSSATFDGDRLIACVDVAFVRAQLQAFAAAAVAKDAAPPDVSPEKLAEEEVNVYLGSGDTLIERALDKFAGKGAGKALRPKGKPTAITKPCEEQFAGRAVVATCSLIARAKGDGGTGFDVGLGVTHYDATAGDGPMRSCLAAKGDWRETRHDSHELGALRRRQMYEKLEKQFGE